ncbi:MAG: sensor histidine kinase [Sulfuricaulis sp.]
MRLNRLLHTTGFRYALLYAVLFGVSVMVLFGVVYWNATGHMERQLRDVVDADLQSLKADYQEGGIDELRRSIGDRIASDRHQRSLYLLQDPAGLRLAGNLAPRDPAPGWHESLRSLTDKEGDDNHRILAHGSRLPGGFYLLIAQDAHQLNEIRELMIGSFGWAFLLVALLAVSGGLVMSAGLLHRVETINRTARGIVQGDLSHRIPTRGTNDEFDQLAANLNRMLERIQMLMEDLRQVSNDIAHDLRTPLGRLRQHLEGARLKARSVAEYETAVDRAIVDTDAILETFAALLRIAQVESGSRRGKFTNVELSQLLQAVVETYIPVAEDSGHKIDCEIAPGVTIRGDRELLTQMFANLIENALSHTPSGTGIRLSLESLSPGVLVTVADRGPGIPTSETRKVLQRFYRLDNSRGTPGSGLGLALVAAVAELHGVEMVLSDHRPGLRVALRFPGR